MVFHCVGNENHKVSLSGSAHSLNSRSEGDVRSLEGDDTLLRPLLKLTSGKNLLSDCRGVDYSTVLLLLLLLLLFMYCGHLILMYAILLTCL